MGKVTSNENLVSMMSPNRKKTIYEIAAVTKFESVPRKIKMKTGFEVEIKNILPAMRQKESHLQL